MTNRRPLTQYSTYFKINAAARLLREQRRPSQELAQPKRPAGSEEGTAERATAVAIHQQAGSNWLAETAAQATATANRLQLELCCLGEMVEPAREVAIHRQLELRCPVGMAARATATVIHLQLPIYWRWG